MKKINNYIKNQKSSNDVVLFTPEYEYLYTPKSDKKEFVLIYEKGNFVIKQIFESGHNKIPLNGVVISILKEHSFNWNEGDIIKIDNYEYRHYANSIYNKSFKRCVIDKHNNKFYGNEILLIDRRYSVFTIVNQDYYEMILKLDPQVRGYVVNSLRKKTFEKPLGREIDKGSYVLLSNATNNMFYERFKENEEIFFEIPLVLENQEITFTYTEYNPKPQGPVNFDASYMAFRLADTCMVYDIDGFSVDKHTRLTGTNVWGYEVAVDENGTVVDANINVKIPENGYVISGVSEYYPILKNDFKLGGKVTINKKTKEITYTGNHLTCCIYRYNIMYNQIKEIQGNVSKLYDLNASLINKYVSKFELLKEKLETRKLMVEYSFDHEREYHLQRFDQYFNKALDYYNQLYKLSIESSKVEVRACWHEPHEKTLEEVCFLLDTLKQSNFNELIVGGVMNSGVIYKSNKYPMSDFVKGYFGDEYKDDYLLCLTKEAKKRNIRIQISSDNFFAINFLLTKDYEKYSKLLAVSYDKKIGSHIPGCEITLFFNPANKEAQEIYLEIYKEMLDNYDLSGIQLDYIRYCIGNDNYLTAYGYNEDTINKFKEQYHYQDDVFELVKNEEIYEQFSDFRRNELTEYVKKVRNLLANYNNVQLTMAVVSEYEIAKKSKLQDWTCWANLNLVDGIYLMAYHLGKEPVYRDCLKAKELVKNKAFVYGGIAPIYNGCNINMLLPQIQGIKEANVDGISLFAFHSFLNRPDLYYYFNNDGPFKNDAIQTYQSKQKVINAYCDELKNKYAKIYMPANGISKKEFDKLIYALEDVSTVEDVDNIQYIAHPNVRIHIDEILSKVKRYLSIINNKAK